MSNTDLIKLPPGIAIALTQAPCKELPQTELEYINNKTNQKSRLGFILGRTAAHQALEKLGYQACPILKDKSGAPIWPAGISGSIAHSVKAENEAVGAAIVAKCTDYISLGLDIEMLDRPFSSSLKSKISTPEEQAIFLRFNQTNPLKIFCCKEAIFKCLYPLCQQYFGYLDASLCAQKSPNCFDFRINRQLGDTINANSIISVFCEQYSNYLIAYCYWMS